MTVNGVYPYALNQYPTAQITPFTYREGATLLHLVNELKKWSNNFGPEVQDIIQRALDNLISRVEIAEKHWQTLFERFIQEVTKELEGLNDQAVANLVANEVSALYSALSKFVDADSRHINACGSEARHRKIALVPDGSHANGAGTGTDNTDNLNKLTAWARESKRPLYIPAGKYYVPGEIDISGCVIEGDSASYYNELGSVIVGNRSGITFNQKSTGKSAITMNISWLRFENTNTALRVSYSVFSKFTGVTVIDSWGPSVICGDPTIIGGLWNEFDRCQFSSLNAQALIIGGKDWANNTVLNTCDFRTKNAQSAAVEFNTSGGFGAINTIFNDCEIRGDGIGVKFSTQAPGTVFNNCYNETHGPVIWIAASTYDMQLNNGVYGSLVNNHVSGKKSFIVHEKGGVDLRVNGGWVTVSSTSSDRNNLSFIDSDLPGSLLLMYTQRPRTTVASTGWKLHANPEIEERDRTFMGGLTIQKRSRPGVSFEYPDGTGGWRLERNGSMGGADEGVTLYSDAGSVWNVNSSGRLRVLKSLGLPEFVQAKMGGETGLYAKVYDSTSGAPRYIRAYTGSEVVE